VPAGQSADETVATIAAAFFMTRFIVLATYYSE